MAGSLKLHSPLQRWFTECNASPSLSHMLQVYVVYFKCNRNLIREMPNVKNYVREIYQLPGTLQPFAFPEIMLRCWLRGTRARSCESAEWLRLGADAACPSSA